MDLFESLSRIAMLEKRVKVLEDSIKNLIEQKGRYNTEQAYNQLVEMYKQQQEL